MIKTFCKRFNDTLEARADWAPLVMRITLALVLLPHGLQKLFGLFGGAGFSGTMNFLTGMMGLPWLIALLVILIESFGSFFILIGFMTRVWAALVAILMVGVISVAHFSNGFFMNWSGKSPGEGYEFHLLLIGLAIAIMLIGPGKCSVRNLIKK